LKKKYVKSLSPWSKNKMIKSSLFLYSFIFFFSHLSYAQRLNISYHTQPEDRETKNSASYSVRSFHEVKINNEDYFKFDLTPEDDLHSCSIFFDSSSKSENSKKVLNLAGIGLMVSSLVSSKYTFAAKDKQKHYVAGLLIAASTSGAMKLILKKDDKNYALKSFLAGVGTSLVVGVGKEVVYDKMMGKGTPDYKDAVVTALGGINGSVTVDLIDLKEILKK